MRTLATAAHSSADHDHGLGASGGDRRHDLDRHARGEIEELAPPFERASGHKLRVVYGPSGGLAGASTAARQPISSSSRARCSTS